MASNLLGDLNDFIQPSQACVKPVPSKKETLVDAVVSIDSGILDHSEDPVTISLNDCLACSGCITSSESVLISQQTYQQLLTILATNKLAVQEGHPKSKVIIVSISPQARTALAVRYGCTIDEIMWKISNFLTQLGVDYVLDTVLARDISLYECGEEFIDYWKRAREEEEEEGFESAKLPLINGSCPGWICYAEKTQPQLLDHISRTKSPQQIMGTLVKYFLLSKVMKKPLNPQQIFHATVMPCYDKKLEASRNEFFDENFDSRDVDCVISTSELVKMIEETEENKRLFSVDSKTLLIQSQSINPITDMILMLDESGRLLNHFGSGAGGYLEYILKVAAQRLFQITLITQNNILMVHPGQSDQFQLIVETQRNTDYQDFVLRKINDSKVLLRFAKVYGFRNVQNLVRKIKTRKVQYDYVEIMACPNGCLNGGGQPKPDSINLERHTGLRPKENLDKMDSLYREMPVIEPLTFSKVETIYREWFGGYSSPLLKASFKAVEKTLSPNFSTQW